MHSCPRRYQLYRLNSKEDSREDAIQSLTFSYGHAVGLGVQMVFEGKDIGEIFWAIFLQWDSDILMEDKKRSKSFWGALHAVRQIHYARQSGFLDEYELVYWKDKPATELSFLIRLPNGFVYRGFVDLVLRHIRTGKVVVIECKTLTATSVNPAQYKNSAQAIGYSIVLDAIFPDLSGYEVYYLTYPTKAGEWSIIPFEKSYLQRALWIRELLLEVDRIVSYEEAQIYPMHGESCFNYFKECEYIQYCTMSTHHLVSPLSEEQSAKIDADLDTYQIQIGFEDLIRAQLSKNVSESNHAQDAMTVNSGDELL